VIIHITMMEHDQAQRAVDLLELAATYAIDGHQGNGVGESIFTVYCQLCHRPPRPRRRSLSPTMRDLTRDLGADSVGRPALPGGRTDLGAGLGGSGVIRS